VIHAGVGVGIGIIISIVIMNSTTGNDSAIGTIVFDIIPRIPDVRTKNYHALLPR
jgi:hypothetical protein